MSEDRGRNGRFPNCHARMKNVFRRFRVLLVKLIDRLVLVPALRLIEPVWKIRITPLHTARMGHLTFNTHIHISRREIEGPEPRTTRIIFGADPCNRQLFDMLKRRIPIVESRAMSAWFNYDYDYLAGTPFFGFLPGFSTEHREIDHNGAVLSFTEEEEAKGKALLRDIGIGDNDWFVCFQARDPAYQVARGGPTDEFRHRDCDIATFLKAARHIAARGGFAVRYGSVVARPLGDLGDSRIVDYSTLFRSDFGDVYLAAKCRFMLGAGTGSILLPPMFNVPVALTNHVPLRVNPTRRHSLYIPKLFREAKSGRWLTCREWEALGMYEHNLVVPYTRWDFPETYDKEGIELVNNSEDDILDLALDMLDRLEGRAPPPEAAELQAFYKRRFYAHVPGMAAHGPDIGARFALKYRDILAG